MHKRFGEIAVGLRFRPSADKETIRENIVKSAGWLDEMLRVQLDEEIIKQVLESKNDTERLLKISIQAELTYDEKIPKNTHYSVRFDSNGGYYEEKE